MNVKRVTIDTKEMTLTATITYCCQDVTVKCDGKCKKAWGVAARPRDENEEFIPDDELGTAPKDLGTYEAYDTKPLSWDEFPNKWCVRQCERSKLID